MRTDLRILLIFCFLLVVVYLEWSLLCARETTYKQNICPPPKSYAWVTVANGNTFLKGAFILGYSLQRVKTKYEFIVLTEMKRDNTTSAYLDLLLKVGRVIHANMFNLSTYDYRGNSFIFKLRALELVQYDKIALLGADSIVLKNIDQVLDCPVPCAVIDTWVWTMNEDAPTTNGDFLVVKPSFEDEQNMLNLLAEIPRKQISTFKDSNNAWLGPFDQGLFNYYYGPKMTALSWLLAGVEVNPIVLFHIEKFEFYKDNFSVIHYPNARKKPWEIGNVSKVFSWELVVWKLPYQMYKNIEVECASSLTLEEQKIYYSLSPVFNDFTCDPGKCNASQPFRDRGEDPTLFELQFLVKTFQQVLSTAKYKVQVYKHWTGEQKEKKIQKIVDHYSTLLQKEEEKRGSTNKLFN